MLEQGHRVRVSVDRVPYTDAPAGGCEGVIERVIQEDGQVVGYYVTLDGGEPAGATWAFYTGDLEPLERPFPFPDEGDNIWQPKYPEQISD